MVGTDLDYNYGHVAAYEMNTVTLNVSVHLALRVLVSIKGPLSANCWVYQ